MKIKEAKENVIKNLTAELENVEASRGGETYFFEIGKFVKNAMDAIESQTIASIRKQLVNETTVGEHTLTVFDEIIKKI